MADENRIATFEWLNSNLYEFRKGTPPINKKVLPKQSSQQTTMLMNPY